VSDERKNDVQALRRVRDEARREAGHSAEGRDDPVPSRVTRAQARSEADPKAPEREPAPALEPPDATAVNAAWVAEPPPRRGLSGLLGSLLERVLRPHFEAQRTFNARQVQLDNEILRHVESRSAATHRHYDRLLGDLGRRLDEADARHALLEEELVRHVQDLVQRIDLVLADSSRGRLSLQVALEEVRERLVGLEDALRRPE
jgi:hypothetical protein